jgi:hypothetical protein
MDPAVPASLTGSQTKLRSSTVLVGLILTWLSANVLVPIAAFALGLIGLSIVLGFWSSNGERCALFVPLLRSASLHAMIWSSAALLVSYLLYHTFGEPAPGTGGLALGSALLAAVFSALVYLLLLAAASWYAAFRQFWQLLFGRSRAPQCSERQRTLSLIAGISCVWFASWATAGLVAAFQYSIAVDFPYALAIDNVRRAEAIDPVLAEKGRDSLLAFALALGTTNRTCPGTEPDDRLIGLDAHRVFYIPAITNSDAHGSTTTWPPDKGGTRSCENG